MYYKARQQGINLPKVVFDLVASDDYETLQGGYGTGTEGNVTITDPLVVIESNLPSYVGGICHKDIQNGALVDRAQTEIDQAIADSLSDSNIAAGNYLKNLLEAKRFTYGGKSYQLTFETLVRVLAFLQSGTLGDLKLLSTAGESLVLEADVSAFATAFYTALLEATNPDNLNV